jgi:hypothetical protein
MPITVSCPNCNRALRVPDELLGKRVKCPACATVLTASPEGSVQSSAAVPPSRESIAPRRRPAPPPEEEEVEPQVRRRRPAPPPEEEYEEESPPEEEDEEEAPRPRKRLSSNYSISAGEWFEYAKIHYSSVLGPMIGYMLIFGLIFGIPYLGGLLQLIIGPPLQAGFVIVSLAQLKGKRWSFGDFFSGFNWYGPLMGNFYLQILIAIGCMLPSLILLAVAAISKSDTMMQIVVIFAVVNELALIYVAIRTNCFGIQLIVDRNYGPIDAIKGSWTLSQGHSLGLFGMSLLLVLIVFAGVLACCIGVLFTAPFAVMAYNAGYLLIAGTRPPRRSAYGRPRPRDEYEE